eukprot:GHVU01007782.1.p1 GENE.GHVU01007782.1~~GHVU01007782.1.p1  ORF type:complete len:144 (+),score=32.52 GHVU01007782.1:93-524(+)
MSIFPPLTYEISYEQWLQQVKEIKKSPLGKQLLDKDNEYEVQQLLLAVEGDEQTARLLRAAREKTMTSKEWLMRCWEELDGIGKPRVPKNDYEDEEECDKEYDDDYDAYSEVQRDRQKTKSSVQKRVGRLAVNPRQRESDRRK